MSTPPGPCAGAACGSAARAAGAPRGSAPRGRGAPAVPARAAGADPGVRERVARRLAPLARQAARRVPSRGAITFVSRRDPDGGDGGPSSGRRDPSPRRTLRHPAVAGKPRFRIWVQAAPGRQGLRHRGSLLESQYPHAWRRFEAEARLVDGRRRPRSRSKATCVRLPSRSWTVVSRIQPVAGSTTQVDPLVGGLGRGRSSSSARVRRAALRGHLEGLAEPTLPEQELDRRRREEALADRRASAPPWPPGRRSRASCRRSPRGSAPAPRTPSASCRASRTRPARATARRRAGVAAEGDVARGLREARAQRADPVVAALDLAVDRAARRQAAPAARSRCASALAPARLAAASHDRDRAPSPLRMNSPPGARRRRDLRATRGRRRSAARRPRGAWCRPAARPRPRAPSARSCARRGCSRP